MPLHLWRIINRRSGVAPNWVYIAVLSTHADFLNMRLLSVKAVLVFVLSETHNKLIITITIITCPSRRSLSLGPGKI